MRSGRPDAGSSSDIPAGYRELVLDSEYLRLIGPFFSKLEDDRLLMGFRVQEKHTNFVGSCHGGLLASVLDVHLSLAPRRLAGLRDRVLVTVSLVTDFISRAPLGSWVESRVDVLKVTSSIAFTQGVATVDGEIVARASGVFKHSPRSPTATSRAAGLGPADKGSDRGS